MKKVILVLLVIGMIFTSTVSLAEENTTGWTVYDIKTGWSCELELDTLGGIRFFPNENTVIKYGEETLKMPEMLETVVTIDFVSEVDGSTWKARLLGDDCVTFTENRGGTYSIIDYVTGREATYNTMVFSEAEAANIVEFFCPNFDTKVVYEFVDTFENKVYKGCYFYFSNGDGEGGHVLCRSAVKLDDGTFGIPIQDIKDLVWTIEVNHQ